MSTVKTPVFRVSWPAILNPKVNELHKDKILEYSLVALFPKGADLSQLKAAAKEAVVRKWGADPAKHPKVLRNPFRDQGERAKVGDDGKEILPGGHEKGAIFITMKNRKRPSLVNQQVLPITDETEFYAGCYAQAVVKANAYDNMGNRGVGFYVDHIQKVRDGEPLDGRTKPEDHFAPIAVEGGEETSSASDLF